MIREVTNMNKHELYHNHNYVYLLTSNIINRCGDSLDTILFTWLVYLLTNSAGWSAIIFGINQATSVIIQPFIGPLVENMNKKKVLVLSDIARVLLVLYILYVYIICIYTKHAFTINIGFYDNIHFINRSISYASRGSSYSACTS